MDIGQVEDMPGVDLAPLLSESQVFDIAATLAYMKLPEDVVSHVLDLAGIVASRRIAHNAVYEDITDDHYLPRSCGVKPPDIPPGYIDTIMFEMVSRHEQCEISLDDHEHEVPWTGFQAAALRNSDLSTLEAQRNGDQEPPFAVDWRVIHSNDTSIRHFRRRHVKISRDQLSNEWVQHMFSRLDDGHLMALRAQAVLESSLNQVVSTSIILQYRVHALTRQNGLSYAERARLESSSSS